MEYKLGEKFSHTKVGDVYHYRGCEIKKNPDFNGHGKSWIIGKYDDSILAETIADCLDDHADYHKLKDVKHTIDKGLFLRNYMPTRPKLTERALEVFELLVPSHGVATTIQGELIRAEFKIIDEFYRNGNQNFIYNIFETNAKNRQDDWYEMFEDGESWSYKKADDGTDMQLNHTKQEAIFEMNYNGQAVKSESDIIKQYGAEIFPSLVMDIIQESILVAAPDVPLGIASFEELEQYEQDNSIELSFGRSDWEQEIVERAIDYFISKNLMVKSLEQSQEKGYTVQSKKLKKIFSPT
jgi:hypothetical protein